MRPTGALFVLAVLVAAFGIAFGRGESSFPPWWIFVLVALGIVGLNLLVGVVRGPENLPWDGQTWPHTHWTTIAGIAAAGLAFIPVGILASNAPVTCGDQVMSPGDRCVDPETGSSSSYSDVANAPITQLWPYVLITVIFLIIAAVKLAQRRQPTPEELAAYQDKMLATRERLVEVIRRLGQDPDTDKEVIRFDAQLRQVLNKWKSTPPTNNPY